ncbi:MAG: DUF2807 domain-containing protein [Spirochaetota bacterium]|nr:MAG: DUF2807 domain-containing protein [Spirochaetota bacterium]
MKRKNVTVLLIILGMIANVLSVTGKAYPEKQSIITGSENIETRQFYYTDFSRLRIHSGIDTDITRAESHAVSITANDNIFEYIEVVKNGDTLHLGMNKACSYSCTTVKATISLPELNELSVTGGSEGYLRGFSSSKPVKYEITGGSTLHLDNITTGDAEFKMSGRSKLSGSITMDDGKFHLSGASSVELKGSSVNLSLKASGASNFSFADFNVGNVLVDIGGGSTATVKAEGRLDVDLNGSSKLFYTGNPTLGNIDISSTSVMSKR